MTPKPLTCPVTAAGRTTVARGCAGGGMLVVCECCHARICLRQQPYIDASTGRLIEPMFWNAEKQARVDALRKAASKS